MATSPVLNLFENHAAMIFHTGYFHAWVSAVEPSGIEIDNPSISLLLI